MQEDIYYQNQKTFAEANGYPLFASQTCNHMYPWVQDERFGKLQTLGEMLVEKFGEKDAWKIASGTLIISCPVCGCSWCD